MGSKQQTMGEEPSKIRGNIPFRNMQNIFTGLENAFAGPGWPWKPHKSKEQIFLHRSYTPNFFAIEKNVRKKMSKKSPRKNFEKSSRFFQNLKTCVREDKKSSKSEGCRKYISALVTKSNFYRKMNNVCLKNRKSKLLIWSNWSISTPSTFPAERFVGVSLGFTSGLVLS